MIRFSHLLVVVSLFAVAWTVLGSHVQAANGTTASNTTGNDISYPQCRTSNYPQTAFGIIGVTGGKAFTNNPCFANEVAWASTLSHPVSLYMNLNAPIGPTAFQGMTGPYGHCTITDKLCQARNYGYNAAQHAFSYAASQRVSSSMWWMDIETANSWSYSTLLNQGTISGATQFFKRQQGIAVGVYSMPSMWRSITGNYRNKLPVWIAASSASPATFCTSKYGFTGGTVYIVQYAFSGFDSDYAC